jgi:hypothetical protein
MMMSEFIEYSSDKDKFFKHFVADGGISGVEIRAGFFCSRFPFRGSAAEKPP